MGNLIFAAFTVAASVVTALVGGVFLLVVAFVAGLANVLHLVFVSGRESVTSRPASGAARARP